MGLPDTLNKERVPLGSWRDLRPQKHVEVNDKREEISCFEAIR